MGSQAPGPQTLSLAGKVAIVTGSGKEPSIGSSIVEALARNGAAVVINFLSDSTKPRAEKLATRLIGSYNAKVITVQASVETKEGAESIAAAAMKAFDCDHIDILVNNAGGLISGETLDLSEAEIQEAFSKNLFSAIHMVRAVVPHMPPGGRIINIASTTAKASYSSISMYTAAKAALDSLSHTWAGEFGRSRGITVNTISPGPIQTDQLKKYELENPEGFKAIQDMIDNTRAAGRLGRVEDIADAVLLLVQEGSRWITGQYIDCSGGITR